jgi:hypothetical protein
MENKNKSIYELKMHETTLIEYACNGRLTTLVIRVPGGWIYRSTESPRSSGDTTVMSSVFVPFESESHSEKK